MIVNKSELAKALDYSVPTITHWVRRGCPVQQEGSQTKAWKFKLSEVVQWLLDQQASPADAAALTAERVRLTCAQADRQEHALQLEREQVVPLEEVALFWADILGAARTRLLAVPTRAAPLVLGCTSLAGAAAILDELICEALTDLSGTGIPAQTKDPEQAAV